MNGRRSPTAQASRRAPPDGPSYDARPELALAALLYLLSRFPATRKPAVARAILAHLQTIGADARMDPIVRECARGLIPDWEAYAQLCEDTPGRVPRSFS